MAHQQAVVFLTHVQSKRILQYFQRLKKETRGLLAAFLCLHDASGVSAPGWAGENVAEPIQLGPIDRILSAILPAFTADLVIDVASGARLLPERFAEMQRRERWYNYGFTDLAYMPALLDQRLSEYEYIWLVENDVDYAGNWHDFFSRTMSSDADLLATHLFPRTDVAAWSNWSWFQTPPDVLFEHQTRSFNPIARFSRRLLSLYVNSVRSGLWQGHTEALFATIARHHGLSVLDLGGTGPFCPEERRNKNYQDYLPAGTAGTFIDYPVVQTAYFHEDPQRFSKRDILYHPVKVYVTKTQSGYVNSMKAHIPAPFKAAIRSVIRTRS